MNINFVQIFERRIPVRGIPKDGKVKDSKGKTLTGIPKTETLRIVHRCNEKGMPKVGSIWKHYKGAEYRVLLFTNTCKNPTIYTDFPDTIVYQNIQDGTVWSRPYSEWIAKFTKVNTD